MATDEELRLLKANYYMNSANTLVLTGTIFIVSFVTALSVTGPKYDMLRMIMLGLVPFGLIALYDGITRYFQAQKLVRHGGASSSRTLALDVLAFLMLMGVFLVVNWLLYETLIPSPLTIVTLLVSVALIGLIKITVERQ